MAHIFVFYSLFLVQIFSSSLVSSSSSLSADFLNVSFSSLDSVERLKKNFQSVGKTVKHEIVLPAVASFAAGSTNSWLLQTSSNDGHCWSGGLVTLSRTDCLKRTSNRSMRVFCNSTTAILQEFDSSASCSGKADSTVISPIGCFPSSSSSVTIGQACISNAPSLPLPAGDWLTFTTYGDPSCNRKNMVVGYKNQACVGLANSRLSFEYDHPKFYQYTSSDSCSGRASVVDFSSLLGKCESLSETSVEYDYLHSDGSSSSGGGQPTKKPTNKPTKKPTRKPTKKPSQRPTRKPTSKRMIINDPSDGSDSSQTTPSESSSEQSEQHHHNKSVTLVAASVCVSVVVVAGLLVWYYNRKRENDGKYMTVNRKEETIVEIPEVL